MPESELLFRSFAEFELRDDGEEWTVEGIAVPWGQTIDVAGRKERFERGAFGEFAGGAPFYADHLHRFGHLPVGRVVASENRDAGQWVKIAISRTAAGADVRTLMQDGVLPGLSVGFKPLIDRQDQGVTVRSRATFGEVSATAFPAYSQAIVTDVRHRTDHREDPMTTTTTEATTSAEDLAELRSTIADMERQLAVLNDGDHPGGAPTSAATKYRSLGHFVKALAPAKGRGREVTDAEALELREAFDEAMEFRAYTGATTAELGTTSKATWIDRDVKLITERRRIFEQFSSERLPAEGMSVEYPKFGSKTGDVGKQVAEGDDLNYLELVITSDSAEVDTYGGWSQLTRQVIERASVAYLNKVLQVQKISYGKITNGALRTVLTGLAGTNTDTLALADVGDYEAWIDLVLQASSDFELNSTTGAPDLWIMGLTQFRQLIAVKGSDGRPLFVVNGDGSNTIGTVDVRAIRANVAGMPVWLDPGLTGDYSYMASRDAITTLESGPFALSDENIVNLSKAFSLYGYLAITANDPKGVTKINHATA